MSDENSTPLQGGCLCGAVRFTATGVKTTHHGCHCDTCRRWSGGPFLGCHAESVEFEGAENITRYDSSEWAQRGFCKSCGSNLFYFLKPAGTYSLSVGAFDDPAPFTLTLELFTERKPPGYTFAGDLKGITGAELFAAHGGS